MCRIGSILIILFLSASLSQSKEKPYSADFLKMGVGERAMALGGAYVGLANDISALFWNPAGLSQLAQHEVIINASLLRHGLYHNFLALGYLWEKVGFLALGCNYLGIEEIPIWSEEERIPPNASPSFTKAHALAGMVGFSRRLLPRLSLGVTVKSFREQLISVSSPLVPVIDLGVLYQAKGFNLGIVCQNFGPRFKYEIEKTALPSGVKIGGKMGFLKDKLIILTDLEKTIFDSKLGFHIGSELKFLKYYALRAGVSIERPTFLSVGFGFNKNPLRVDYALLFYPNLGPTHRTSIIYSFGGEIGRKRALERVRYHRMKQLRLSFQPSEPVVVAITKKLTQKSAFARAVEIFTILSNYSLTVSPRIRKPMSPGEIFKERRCSLYNYLSLFLACLKSAEVPFILLSIPEEEVLLINPLVPLYLKDIVSPISEDYFIWNDSLWLPLDVTLLRETFFKAWRSGVEKLKTVLKKEYKIITLKPLREPKRREFKLSWSASLIKNKVNSEIAQFTSYRNKLLEKSLQSLQRLRNKENLNKLGTLLAKEARYEEALASFKEALSRDKKAPQTYLNLGNLYLIKGDFVQAEVEYQIVEQLDIGEVQVYFNRAILHLLQNNLAEAKEEIKLGLAKFPSQEAAVKFFGLKKALPEEKFIQVIYQRFEKRLKEKVYYPNFTREKQIARVVLWK
jgi:tetratricopeptide (TPR) repeat protein